MYRVIYLASMSISAAALLAGVGIAAFLENQVSEEIGKNAGGFLLALSFLSVGIGVTLSTLFAAVGFFVSYVYPDKLPATLLYKLRWPVALAAPGLLCLGILLASWVSSVI
ncbi:hypothetical protein GCM10025772_17980 [Ferrimonas gelatinilytica]|uniref:Uncharacterized protein n=1 Tax=Ferrimonas gelatinilytica TaxID=1255257 RepID=A0ABP9S4T5_9GAMM